MHGSFTHTLGELRSLLAQRPSSARDATLCAWLAFTSRVVLEQRGAWAYLCAASQRGSLGHTWDDASWLDVRAGRMWGHARGEGRIDLCGTFPLKPHVLDALIARTHATPLYSLDLGYLGDTQGEVLAEFLARADLSHLCWLDLSSDRARPEVTALLRTHDLPALRSLELNRVGVHALKHAPCLAQLVHLGVSRCDVDDGWLRAMITPARMPALRSLDLSETRVASAVWDVLGEQQGFEEMYALKMHDTLMTTRDLGVCRWLPCMASLDTLAMDVQGEQQGLAHEESVELFTEGCEGLRDLSIFMVDVSEDVQHNVLRALAHTTYYRSLCALGIGGAWMTRANMSALGVSEELDGATPLRAFALRRVRAHKDVEHDGWSYYRSDPPDVLTHWARLGQVHTLSIEMREHREREDADEWLLDYVLTMPELERVSLHNLHTYEWAAWCKLWVHSKVVARLEAVHMHDSDLTLYTLEAFELTTLAGPARFELTTLAGPARWIISGMSQEAREALLALAARRLTHDSAMSAWLSQIDLELL